MVGMKGLSIKICCAWTPTHAVGSCSPMQAKAFNFSVCTTLQIWDLGSMISVGRVRSQTSCRTCSGPIVSHCKYHSISRLRWFHRSGLNLVSRPHAHFMSCHEIQQARPDLSSISMMVSVQLTRHFERKSWNLIAWWILIILIWSNLPFSSALYG